MPDTNTPTPEQVLLTWSAPVQHTHERSTRWYIVGGTAVIAAAAYGVLTGAWSVALVTIMIGAMYFILRDHRFPDETATITQGGIRISDTYINWNDTQGFWLLPTDHYMELHVVPKTQGKSDLIIQTGTMDIQKLRETIGAWIPELTDKRERFLDAFIRICKL